VTSAEILTQRQAQALNEAAELIRAKKPDTPRLDAALAEVFISDEGKTAALVFELCEMVVRQERTIDHMDTHITKGQDVEIERLAKRVEKLEKGAKPKRGKE
jgi:hypothetical protein